MDIDDILKDFEESSRTAQTTTTTTTSRTSPSHTSNLYQELLTSMINERMSPELLPYQHSLMSSVLSAMSSQQQYLLESHEYGDLNAGNGAMVSSDFKLLLMIIETDLERLNFIVRMYIRARITKLNKFTIFYINESNQDSGEDEEEGLLSKQEKVYLLRYFLILSQLYNNCFLKKMPQELTFLDDTRGAESMVVAPDIDQPVFIRCVLERPIILDRDGNTEIDLELVKDGVYVVKYSLVKKYIEIGDIVMI
ncbi:DNA replication complex GINS protein SLD5 [Candida viswanathii]|uniref:DNA replication complex GINS protein SLD5 n=1 Tax=Candida viswanathii TaxID=5486 RepID=A0A367YM18_9ASCO|nr:DNA replication complex GINS protein SLD5 [Candida viswanathii]